MYINASDPSLHVFVLVLITDYFITFCIYNHEA